MASAPGFSSTIAYDLGQKVDGNQAWFGALGMDFQVNTAVTVTTIGVFSNNAWGNSTASPLTDMNAAIFSLADDSIIPATEVSFATTGTYNVIDNWLFQSIPATVLQPGLYTIVAQGYNASDPNGNLGVSALPSSVENTFGSAITYIGSARYETPVPSLLPNPVDFPSTIDSGPTNRYYAGDFGIATPEPGMGIVVGGGLAILLGLRRRSGRTR